MPRAAPIRVSASAPVRTSWPSTTGSPQRSVSCATNGTSRQPRFSDHTATPRSSSTTPGTASPIAAAGRHSSTSSATASTIPAGVSGVGRAWKAIGSPSTSVAFMSVPPTSMPTTRVHQLISDRPVAASASASASGSTSAGGSSAVVNRTAGGVRRRNRSPASTA